MTILLTGAAHLSCGFGGEGVMIQKTGFRLTVADVGAGIPTPDGARFVSALRRGQPRDEVYMVVEGPIDLVAANRPVAA